MMRGFLYWPIFKPDSFASMHFPFLFPIVLTKDIHVTKVLLKHLSIFSKCRCLLAVVVGTDEAVSVSLNSFRRTSRCASGTPLQHSNAKQLWAQRRGIWEPNYGEKDQMITGKRKFSCTSFNLVGFTILVCQAPQDSNKGNSCSFAVWVAEIYDQLWFEILAVCFLHMYIHVHYLKLSAHHSCIYTTVRKRARVGSLQKDNVSSHHGETTRQCLLLGHNTKPVYYSQEQNCQACFSDLNNLQVY